jgi:ABC-type amino acid transport substrate-binding protein
VKIRTLIIAALLVALLPVSAPCVEPADRVTVVITAGPSWETFTNRDGTGLYHEVLDAVFALYGIPVRHEYVPSDRADELVRLGWADMMLCDDRAEPPLRLSRYPLYVNDYHVLFNRDRIGPWKGAGSLRGREIAAQKGFYHDWDFPVPVRIREMPSGVKCLEMVLLGRSDFYVDDMAFIRDSINRGPEFDRAAFDVRKAGRRSYHPMFNTTPRSDLVIRMFDDGMRTLHEQGALRAIYEKWGHTYPDFDSY